MYYDIYQYVRCVWRNSPELKYTRDFNKLLQQTKANNRNTHRVFPIHLYCLAVPRDRTSSFPLRFFPSRNIYTCILYLAHGRLRRRMRCTWEPGMPWMWQGCTWLAVWSRVEHAAPAGNAVSPHHKLLQSRRRQKWKCFFFFSLPPHKPSE